MADKKILVSSQTKSKTFNYQKGNVSLNFTLRVDIKQDLKDFLEALIQAEQDVRAELELLSNKK